ncbi:MAG: hypothetical protein QN193_08040 [Armatimonadota bacterium]|nr:hypothetical protein [Armatimonadota bacterium]MDR7440424.1 hypothetical protein [Armatimonadota bacterium]MDR7444958.1 hypothetical protein [Armatimonadota bacterium]MDR7570543.1 hypothetical protein [Armatimonadota bacterium]MDR7615107.1 hypothetical protein [Armatimonadota bacterium]
MTEPVVALSQLLDALSEEAGCPLLVAAPDGTPLAAPRQHVIPCLQAPKWEGVCQGARAFLAGGPPGAAGVRTCPKNAQPHLVVPVVNGSRQAVVMAELWLARNPRTIRARAERMARVAADLVQKALPTGPPEARVPVGEVPSRVVRQALADGRLTPEGLRRLRTRYRLSWREVEVLVLYYLTAHGPDQRVRTTVGQALGLTEGSVREYVRRVRRKLGVRFRRSPEVWVWAREQGLTQEGR